MQITVKLFATLRVGRFIEQERAYAAGVTVGEIMDDLAITAQDAPLVFVNGRHTDRDRVLEDADTVAFFPPIGGG
jgi:sulfur-carrier protein